MNSLHGMKRSLALDYLKGKIFQAATLVAKQIKTTLPAEFKKITICLAKRKTVWHKM